VAYTDHGEPGFGLTLGPHDMQIIEKHLLERHGEVLIANSVGAGERQQFESERIMHGG
jgi:hypothetical protein